MKRLAALLALTMLVAFVVMLLLSATGLDHAESPDFSELTFETGAR